MQPARSRSGKSQPTISHHTKVLADAGLIRGEKRGRWVWWRIVPERLDDGPELPGGAGARLTVRSPRTVHAVLGS